MRSQPLFCDGTWRFYSVHKRCNHLYTINFIMFFQKPKMPGSDRLPYSNEAGAHKQLRFSTIIHK
ncbi:MAG: hypothetical protein IRD7MM_04465 [Candidatus Midichloria mitochondrii]